MRGRVSAEMERMAERYARESSPALRKGSPSCCLLSPELDLRVLGPAFGWSPVLDANGEPTPFWLVPWKGEARSEERGAGRKARSAH